MPNTEDIKVTTSWQRVAEGASFFAAQIQSNGLVQIFMGDEAPEENSNGMLLSDQDPQLPSHFSAGSVPAGSYVALRSREGDVAVCVISY